MPLDEERLKNLVKRINKTGNADFVKRLLDPNRKVIYGKDGSVMTHRLGYVDNGNGNAVVFPEVQSSGDSLVRYPFPQSYERAVSRGDTVQMSVPEAELFTKRYKDYYPGFKQYWSGGISQQENRFDRGSRLARREQRKAERQYIKALRSGQVLEGPEEQSIFFDGTLEPAVITAPLPEKFHGSQAAARRYAEAQGFGKDIIQKRDEEFRQYAPVVFGAPIAAGLGAAAVAPLAYTASTMAPVELANALTEGLSYLQPSKYIDWAARGFRPASSMLKTVPYYTGATTLGGVLADTALDSAFMLEGARNAGKTGSVPGEIVNATNFLPAIGPVVGAYGQVQRAWPEIRDWSRMVLAGDMSPLIAEQDRAVDLLHRHGIFEKDFLQFQGRINNGEDLVRVEVPTHVEKKTLLPLADATPSGRVVNGSVSTSPFHYGDTYVDIPYRSADIGAPGQRTIETQRRVIGYDPLGETDDVMNVHVERGSTTVPDEAGSFSNPEERWSYALRSHNMLPSFVTKTPVDEIKVRSRSKTPLATRAFERNDGGSTLDILAPQAAEKSRPIRDYMDNMNSTLGNDGVVAGSTTLHAKGFLSGTPHDTEVITTKSRLPEVEKKLGFTKNGGNDIAVSGTAKKGFNGGDMDIQVIQETDNGEATGRLAWSLYRTMHPADYQRQAEMSVLYERNYTDRTIINPNTGVPYTADELLEEFVSGGFSLKNTVIDALSVMKDFKGKNIHKHNRPMSLLTNTDPEATAAVSDAISTIGVSQIGTGFKKGSEYFPGLSFDDVAENRKFLEKLGIESKDVEENPEAMRNLFDYWYMQQSIQKRGVYGADKDLGKARRWTLESNYNRGGGAGSGAGRNTVMATTREMPFSYPYVGAMQTHLTNPETAGFVTSLNEVVDMAERLKNTSVLSAGQVQTAQKAFAGNYQNLMDSDSHVKAAVDDFFSWIGNKKNPTMDDLQEGLGFAAKKLQANGLPDTLIESTIDGLAESFGTPFFRNMGSWYEQKYIGVLRKDSDAGGVRYFDFASAPNYDVRPYEFGRDVEGYASRSTADPYNSLSNARSLSPTEAAEYFPESTLDWMEKFNKRMRGEDGGMTIGELRGLSPEIKVIDEREQLRDFLYDWLDNTHDYEDAVRRIDRLESLPGVKTRQQISQKVAEARQARADRRFLEETEKIKNFRNLSRTERNSFVRKFFNDNLAVEPGLSNKFSDYKISGSATDGSGFMLIDKKTGQIVRLTRDADNKWYLSKGDFNLYRPIGTKLRKYSSYVNEALQNSAPGDIPSGFNANNIKYAEEMPDGTIRLHYGGPGFDVLEKINGKWQFESLPFANGGMLLRDYETGGKIHTSKLSELAKLIKGTGLSKEQIKDRIRQRMYDNIHPQYYDDFVNRAVKALTTSDPFKGENHEFGNPGMSYSDKRDDIFATYLQIPEDKRHKTNSPKVKDSQYKPSVGGEDKQYKRIELSPEEKDALIIEAMKPGGTKVSPVLQSYFGPHTIGHGADEKGEYVSYYDRWDLNPNFGASADTERQPKLFKWVFGKKNGEDISRGIGKPIDFYDRIYLNEHYGVPQPSLNPDEYFGGWIRPAYIGAEQNTGYSITGNDYDESGLPIGGGRLLSSGGGIHIKPENRGKFTAKAKRAGQGVQQYARHVLANKENYPSSTVKQARFAKAAASWQHGDGGLIERLNSVYGDDRTAMLEAIKRAKERQMTK